MRRVVDDEKKGDESAARVLRYVSLVAIGAVVGGMISGLISGFMSLGCWWLYPCIILIGGDDFLVVLSIIICCRQSGAARRKITTLNSFSTCS